jgi:hypothetical protein
MSFSNVTEPTSAGAATGRTTVWSFTLIPVEFIDESNSEIVMLR